MIARMEFSGTRRLVLGWGFVGMIDNKDVQRRLSALQRQPEVFLHNLSEIGEYIFGGLWAVALAVVRARRGGATGTT